MIILKYQRDKDDFIIEIIVNFWILLYTRDTVAYKVIIKI